MSVSIAALCIYQNVSALCMCRFCWVPTTAFVQFLTRFEKCNLNYSFSRNIEKDYNSAHLAIYQGSIVYYKCSSYYPAILTEFLLGLLLILPICNTTYRRTATPKCDFNKIALQIY